jgi:orotate phosphoribosyltransferase
VIESVGAVFSALPARRGHFVLESGYHTDVWLTLDALFADPASVASLVAALADRFRPYRAAAVCGPLLGGAFLAQAMAVTLGVAFYYTEPERGGGPGLFTAGYRLPSELKGRARGQRVVVVDDVISAGSSVRATVAALAEAGATTVAVGALFILGNAAVDHFASQQVPVETLGRRDFALWKPEECPFCRQGDALEDPRAGISYTDAP